MVLLVNLRWTTENICWSFDMTLETALVTLESSNLFPVPEEVMGMIKWADLTQHRLQREILPQFFSIKLLLT